MIVIKLCWRILGTLNKCGMYTFYFYNIIATNQLVFKYKARMS